ncbi:MULTISPECIES: hypothetical protein [unclassified Ensifer]|uniref:hypothetical protein n=1 Tax=unclassified Ensifer TaxID=2633371 RepID=UPI0012E355B6|nr:MULTISPECIES: hypothetical protein [unclassified Ensifer]
MKSLMIEEATAIEIGAMLGLAARHVEENLTRLLIEQLVSQTTDELAEIRYRITDLGRDRLENGQSRPQDETLVFDYDLLFQSPVKLTDAQIESSKEARQDGTILLPPATLDPPDLQTLPLNTLGQAVRRIGGKEFQKQILGLRRILRHQMMFRPSTGLLFRNRLSGDLELGLVVDEKLSERHEIEFSRTGGLKKAGFIKGSWSEDVSRIKTFFGPGAWAKAADDQAEAIQSRLKQLGKERTELVEMHERKRRSREKLKGQNLQAVDDLDQQIITTKAKLDALPLRAISPPELGILIRDALEHTENELIISIDEVDHEGMSRQIVGRLGKLAEHAVVEIKTNDPIDPVPIGERGKFEPGVQLWSLASLHRRLTLSERGSEFHGLSILIIDQKRAIIAAGPLFRSTERRPHLRVQTGYLTNDLDIIGLVRQKLENGAPVVA